MRKRQEKQFWGIRLRFPKRGPVHTVAPAPETRGGTVRLRCAFNGTQFLEWDPGATNGTLNCQIGPMAWVMQRAGRRVLSLFGYPAQGLAVLRTIRACGDTFPAIPMALEDRLAQ